MTSIFQAALLVACVLALGQAAPTATGKPFNKKADTNSLLPFYGKEEQARLANFMNVLRGYRDQQAKKEAAAKMEGLFQTGSFSDLGAEERAKLEGLNYWGQQAKEESWGNIARAIGSFGNLIDKSKSGQEVGVKDFTDLAGNLFNAFNNGGKANAEGVKFSDILSVAGAIAPFLG